MVGFAPYLILGLLLLCLLIVWPRGEEDGRDSLERDEEEREQRQFIRSACALAGMAARADGSINETERKSFLASCLSYFSGQVSKEVMLNSFENGELRGREVTEKLAHFYWSHSERKEELDALLDFMFQISFADGAMNAAEEHLLQTYARVCGIHAKRYRKLESKHLAQHYRRVATENQHHFRGQRSTQSSAGESLALERYYRILELPSHATPQDVKQAYRKLVKQHHPDRVKANGTNGSGSQSYQSNGEDRFHQIQLAYEKLAQAGRA